MRPCDLCQTAEHYRWSAIVRRLDGRYAGVIRCRDHDACRRRALFDSGLEWLVDERRAGQLSG